MAVQRKILSYAVRVVLDAGTNDAAKAFGATYGSVAGIGGAIDVENYDDELLVSLIEELEQFYENPVSAVTLTATYGLENEKKS